MPQPSKIYYVDSEGYYRYLGERQCQNEAPRGLKPQMLFKSAKECNSFIDRNNMVDPNNRRDTRAQD